MKLDFDSADRAAAYRTMIQCIVPRPIAWVISDSGNDSLNLAPFSFFNGVGSEPPLLSISIGRKEGGEKKDTWRNIEERSHFVVHIAHTDLAPQVSDTSAALGHGVSEVERSALALTTEPGWSLPRLAAARIAMLCSHHQVVEIGEDGMGLVLGQIHKVHIDDSILKSVSPLQIDAHALDPLARLGGIDYAALGKTFSIPRPE